MNSMSWKNKIKEGYFYRIEGNLIIDTGYTGAIEAGEFMEFAGYSSDKIESMIKVFKDGKWQELNTVKEDD